jgi:hypothetical protein
MDICGKMSYTESNKGLGGIGMATEMKLLQTIEQVREQMYRVAHANRMNLVADEIVSISHTLDWLLVKVQRERMETWRRKQKRSLVSGNDGN